MEGDLSTGVESAVSEQSLWDQMLLEERKIEAEKRGLRVCDIEEETSLTLALEESVINKKTRRDRGAKQHREGNNSSQPNEQIESPSSLADDTTLSNHSKRALATAGSVGKDLDDRKITGDNDDDGQYQDEIIKCQMPPTVTPSHSTEISNTATDDTPLQELSIWQLSLPHDLGMRVLDFLQDIDMCGYLNQIAKTNCFKPTEAVYKILCEHIYTAQSKKKKLIVENWKSWRNMLGNIKMRIYSLFSHKWKYLTSHCMMKLDFHFRS
jgi:hypothetical protein